MIDKEKIALKLEQLREYVGYLKGYQKCSPDELKSDHTLRGAVERYFQLTAECVIDICEIIISQLKMRKPEEYRQAIEILGENDVLPGAFASHLAPIAGFRNVLVHEYAEVDVDEVYNHLQTDLDDMDRFGRYISDFLEKQ